MQRRVALKNIVMAAGAFMILPACDTGWKKASAQAAPASLSPAQEEILAEIVETIIPATDTPGAKELGVSSFIQKMVADCYEKEVQENLVKGVDGVEKLAQKSYGKSFIECSSTQRTELLQKLELSGKDNLKEFYTLVKELTIEGYLKSEYVMKNITKYQMVPGHYYGCVPVTSKTLS